MIDTGTPSQNSSASTSDWIGQAQGRVIYAYDLGMLLERAPATNFVWGDAAHGAAVLRAYARRFERSFEPDGGPEEPLGFEPEDYPVR